MLICRILLVLGLWSDTACAQTPTATRLDAATHAVRVADFQRELNHVFSDPKQSPLSEREQQKFKTLPYYPVSYDHYVAAQLVRDSTSQPFPMPTSTDRRPLYRKYGELHFTPTGQPQQLSIYQSVDLLKRPGLEDYLFVPFTDLTNGYGSYGGGSYLGLRLPAAGATTMLLDFNRAYNPS